VNPSPCITVSFPTTSASLAWLGACGRSVLAQRECHHAGVIVVDDGSPLPAHEELAPLLASIPPWPSCAKRMQARARRATAASRASIRHRIRCVPRLRRLLARLVHGRRTGRFEHGCDMFFANTQRFGGREDAF